MVERVEPKWLRQHKWAGRERVPSSVASPGTGLGKRLGVVPRWVVDAVDGRFAVDAGVGSVVIVVMDPGLVGGGSCFVAEVGVGVGPFG